MTRWESWFLIGCAALWAVVITGMALAWWVRGGGGPMKTCPVCLVHRLECPDDPYCRTCFGELKALEDWEEAELKEAR